MPMQIGSVDERTEFSRGYDRGNYGNAYESGDWETWTERNNLDEHSEPYRAGALLGYFSSYELDEIDDEETRERVAFLRVAARVDGLTDDGEI